MEYNVEEINRLIRHRRSVFPKQYAEGKQVEDAIVRQILENATWAPSHGQTEPWKFVVFTGEGLQKLATFQAELYKKEAGENFKEATYQNMYLTTVAYGVGGYWTTGGVTYKPSAKEFFGLGEDDKLLGFFYLGQI